MKNEAAFWAAVRGRLHVPPLFVCRKLSDQFTAGTPDAFFIAGGVTAYLELKYAPRWPVRVDTFVIGLTEEQRRYLELLRDAGAPAYVLSGVGRDVILLDPEVVPVGGRVRVADVAAGRPGVRFRGRLDGLAPALVALTRRWANAPGGAGHAGGGRNRTGPPPGGRALEAF